MTCCIYSSGFSIGDNIQLNKTNHVTQSRKNTKPKITEQIVEEIALLYLATQIRFLIGGERVTCHWSKLHDALGQQQLKLSTRT